MNYDNKERIDFLDPVVFKKIETDCYRAGCQGKTIDYSDFPAAEYRYFERLCGVYERFNHGELSQDEAIELKQKYFSQYRNDLDQYLKYSQVCKKHQETIKATELLCSSLCKTTLKLPEDVVEALRKALAIISAARGEDVTEKTVLRKLKMNASSVHSEK